MTIQSSMPEPSVDQHLLENLRQARLEIEELGLQLEEVIAKFDEEICQQQLKRGLCCKKSEEPFAAIVDIEDLVQLQRLRAAREGGGLAELASEWENADEFAQVLDKIVQDRHCWIPEQP